MNCTPEIAQIKKAEQLEELIDEKIKGIKGIKYLFIDEVQNVKNFEEVVNSYREDGEFSIFLTGSNSYLLGALKFTMKPNEVRLYEFE